MEDNVLKFPTIGKAITLSDQGVYFTMNPRTGAVHSILRLDFENAWYLHQLQKTDQEDEYGWALMATGAHDTLQSMTTHEIRNYFSIPAFAEPKGAWQAIRNMRFGFAKFTPINEQELPRFALITFVENAMLMPILLVKADESTLQQAEATLGHHLEFA